MKSNFSSLKPSHRKVKIVKYDYNWPKLFKHEAKQLEKTLEKNVLSIHHIGSTSIEGLSAKPVIDILIEVQQIKDVDQVNAKMKALGYEPKGEFGIPFRRFFQKRNDVQAYHVHIFQKNSPEIERYLKFRDWMRSHPEDSKAYESLKIELAKKFPTDLFQYCNGKEAFIKLIDAKDGYEGWRLVHATSSSEWKMVRNFRQKYFFKENKDPYTWTFDHKDHIHFAFYKNTEIIGYMHLQLWPRKKAIMRIMVIDEPYRHSKYGSQLLSLCENWLIEKGYQVLVAQSTPQAFSFYCKNGYIKMPFNDLEVETDPRDIQIGKSLIGDSIHE